MKKVMVVIPALGSGGGERLAVSVIAHMNPRKVQTRLVVLYPRDNTENAKYVDEMGIDVVYLNKHKGIDVQIVERLKIEIQAFRPDVIQTHLYVVSYVLLASPRKIRKYHTVHNVAEKEAEGFRRFISRIAFRFGNFIPVAISPYCAETIEQIYHIRATEIPCIINGVDTTEYFPNHRKHNGIRFINVGRLQTQKNQQLAIRAFAEVHKENPLTRLKIVGEGELRGELEQLVKKLGIENVVSFDGQSSEVNEKLNSADVFVQSSDYEGLPISVLEAMACGLPIVSTKAGGTIDIVEDNVNGFLVEMGDLQGLARCMAKLAQDEKLRDDMGGASRHSVIKYDISKCAQEYEKLYFQS